MRRKGIYRRAMKRWKWYVYELFDDAGVFYVGKGSGNRINVTRRTGSKPKLARAKSGKSRIVAYFRSEKDAFSHEAERITWYEGLTNIALVSKTQSTAAIKEWADALWSRIYHNVNYEIVERQQCYEMARLCYEKLSKEIKCLEAGNAKALADHLEFATRKLLRCSRPLSQKESRLSITCSN